MKVNKQIDAVKLTYRKAVSKLSKLGDALIEKLTKSEAERDATLSVTLATDLKKALRNKELLIHYQPIVDLNTGKISGMEALLRWQHPRFGMISPIDLMPLIEVTVLGADIGAWVLEEACSQAAKWNKDSGYFNTLKLCVNLSLAQLRQEHFLETLDRILKKSKLDPKLLILELPQVAILEKEDIAILNEVSKMGITFSIDDFGTASSKWSSFKSFGIIKIDNSFIQMVTKADDNNRKIVSAIFAMATSLGIKTLAEGVETQEQYQFLKDKKCDFIQGYYFSKPLKTTEFTELLENPKDA